MAANSFAIIDNTAAADGHNDVDRHLAIFTGNSIDSFCCGFAPDGYSLILEAGLIKLLCQHIPSAGLYKRFTADKNERMTAIRTYDFRKFGKCTGAKIIFWAGRGD